MQISKRLESEASPGKNRGGWTWTIVLLLTFLILCVAKYHNITILTYNWQAKLQRLEPRLAQMNSPATAISVTQPDLENPVKIAWNGKPWQGFFGEGVSIAPAFRYAKCSFSNCVDEILSTNKGVSEDYTVHVNTFNWGLPNTQFLKKFPRTPGQSLLAFYSESPSHHGGWKNTLRAYDGIFNGTMSYRRDADVIFGYGIENRYGSMIDATKIPYPVLPKARKVVSIISNCQNPRINLVRKISKMLGDRFDGYGTCLGGRRIPGGHFGQDLHDLVAKNRIYLSFENSRCQDYITEKFWSTAGTSWAYPFVFGGRRRSDYEAVVMHNDSFYYVEPDKLGEAVSEMNRLLDMSDVEFKEFITARPIVHRQNPDDVGFCGLCKYANEIRDSRSWRPAMSGEAFERAFFQGRDPKESSCQRRRRRRRHILFDER